MSNFWFVDAGVTYQLRFQDPATTTMEGIYLFNLYLLFVIISIVIVVSWLLFSVLRNFTKFGNSDVATFAHPNFSRLIRFVNLNGVPTILNNDIYLTDNTHSNGEPLIASLNYYTDLQATVRSTYEANPQIFRIFEFEANQGKAYEILNPSDPITNQLYTSIEYASKALNCLDQNTLSLIDQFMGSGYGIMPTASALLFLVLVARTSAFTGVKYPFLFKLWVSCPYILEKSTANDDRNFIVRMNLSDLNSRIDVLGDLELEDNVHIPYLDMLQLLTDSGCLPLQNYLNNFSWSSNLNFKIFLSSLNPVYTRYIEWTAVDFPELPSQLPQASLNFLLEKFRFVNILEMHPNAGMELETITHRLRERRWDEITLPNEQSMWYYLSYIFYARRILKLSSFIIGPMFMAPESIEPILAVAYSGQQTILPFAFSIQAIEAFRSNLDNRQIYDVLRGTTHTGAFDPVHINVISSLHHLLQVPRSLPSFYAVSHYSNDEENSVLDYLLHRNI